MARARPCSCARIWTHCPWKRKPACLTRAKSSPKMTKAKRCMWHMRAGTVRVWQRLRDQWQGTIMFVGQPAEETGNGARALLKAGLYTRFGKPNFALGFHDKADLEIGHIA